MDMSGIILKDETGVIVDVSRDEKIGWVRNDRDRSKAFLHVSDFPNAPGGVLPKGERVVYDAIFPPKGAKATNVRII